MHLYRLLMSPMVLAAAMLMGPDASAQGMLATVAGRSLGLAPPPGYCALGAEPVEAERFAVLKKSIAPTGELLVIALRCGDLARFKAGTLEDFGDWYQVIALKDPDGAIAQTPYDRPEFLRRFAGANPESLVDADEILRKAQQLYVAKSNVELLKVTAPRSLGASRDAVYSVMQTVLRVNNDVRPVYAVFAITSVKNIVLAVYAYRSPTVTGKTSVDGLPGYVHSIVTQN